MNIMLTGCAGVLGSSILQKLLDEKHTVIGIDSLVTSKKERIDPYLSNSNFSFYYSLNEYKIHHNKNIDAIIHTAGVLGVSSSIYNPQFFYNNNVMFTLNLLEFAKKYNIPKFIYSSSASVYGDLERDKFLREDDICAPSSPYALSKYNAEELVTLYHHMYGIKTYCLRYCNIISNKEYYMNLPIPHIFIRQAVNNKPITIYGKGDQLRQYVPVENIVSANLLCLSSNLDLIICNITIDEFPISLNELCDIIQENLQINIIRTYNTNMPLGDIVYNYCDNRLAKNKLGYRIIKTFKEGFQEILSKYKK